MTEDEIPFIRAMLASPFDPQPRRMYAEWLDARRDPRADYIRSRMAINDPNTPAEERERHSARLRTLHGRISRHWTSYIERVPAPDNEGPAPDWPPEIRIEREARLGCGPCVICGRKANQIDAKVSRMPCVRCGRVLCWQCADTGVYGSLADFQCFVTDSYRLDWDSCPFCQDVEWMTAHGG